MADFFYFLSSLPTLRWGEKPPMAHDRFMAQCRELLGDKLADEIGALRLLPEAKRDGLSPVAAAWYDFETFLRNTTGAIRKNRVRKSNLVMTMHKTSHFSALDTKRIEEIMSMASPLERENALDGFRWSFLEGLSTQYAFSKGAAEIYAIKLLLLEKQESRQYEAGKTAFDKLMNAGFDKAVKVRTTEEGQEA